MKVSLNLVRFMSDTYGNGLDPAPEGIDTLIHRIGTQLGAIEEVIYTGKVYEGLVVAKIVSCEKHPDADKLNVCRVDDGGVVKDVERGDDGLVQVVCGAPNARANITVAWLPPNSTVPASVGKEPFVLSVRDIRGVKSNGMLASPAELAISDNHDGILEIEASDVGDELSKPGTPFKALYSLDDVVIDMENKMFTHRPDCFGTIGVARELAGISGQRYQSPEWYLQPLQNEMSDTQLPLQIVNDIPGSVPRFMAQVVADVRLGASPMWLQTYLARIGSRALNNIIDYTNFFMMETGQPMHAFDYDKIKALSGDMPTLGPRFAKEGEELTLLSGKTIKLTKDDMVIATDKKAVALAGVMGGAETEVDETTKNIIIECATFDMYTIRRTSMRHGLFTDAVTRYTKGQSPLQNDRVLAKIVDEIVRFADGKVASEAHDLASDKVAPGQSVQLTADFINTRLGSDLTAQQMSDLLTNVEIEVAVDGDALTITPPFWRTDLEIPEDIVEEIGRLYGYDKLPLELPKRGSKPAPLNQNIVRKQIVRDTLAAAGANELLTYSFVHGNLLDKVGQNKDLAYSLSNALSPDLQYYRLSLTPSLLEKVQPNLKSDMVRSDDNEFALFEIGRSHIKGLLDEDGLPNELETLALVIAADDKTAARKYAGSAYYQAKKYLTDLAGTFGIRLTFDIAVHAPKEVEAQQMMTLFEPARSAFVRVNGDIMGFIGEYKASVKRALKLPDYCAGFEVQLEAFQASNTTGYVPLPKFPKVQQDMSLKVPVETTYEAVFNTVYEAIESNKPEDTFVTLGPVDIYQSEQDQTHKNISLRLWISAYNRTLTAEEVNSLLDKAAEAAKTLQAQRI